MDTTQDSAATDPATPLSRWARATRDDGEALRELAGSYWYCAYAWWRRSEFDAESAATATLAAFTRWIAEAPPRATDSGGGRMREWLPARLAELSAQSVALEGEPAMAIDPAWAEVRYEQEPEGRPDDILQRRWALTMLEFTMEAVRAEYAARGKEALFAEVSPFAGFEGGDDERYATAASRVGLTVGGARKAVFDFRARHRELLRAFVGDTVADPADLDSEITALLCACDVPGATPASLPTAIRRHKPEELLARAMRTVQMSSGGAGQWTPPSDAEITRLFPQYEMLGMLGRGGMGAVYKARQIELDRLVAIKLLPLEISVDKDFADRFRREARAMAKLNHPNIIAVHDFGTTTEGHLFFAMEYVEGANLADTIHRVGLDEAQTLGIAEQVCTALAYAHGKGIVHRDIKPANVMISTEGHVKVADFGLARLTDPKAEQMGQTMTGTVMGTPDYMAPEQMKGMNVDHRADIYSLGVMLYEMLCREVPKGIFEPPSHRTGCDVRLDQIVIRAMQQKPDRRYQTTAELKADVTAARTPLAIVPITPTQVVHPHPVAKPALPAPQAAVMKAIAPPASAKSKLPLYVGIAVVVLAVVVLAVVVLAVVGGAVFLAKSKPKTLAAPKSDNATPAAPEPGAIKLWDAPDKFTPSARVRWENNAVRLDGQGLREKVPVRDLALRATVLLNSDAVNSQIQVRSLRPTQGKRDGRFYSLGPSGDLKSLVLAVTIEGTGKPLKTWPLPRPPGPDQWLPLELRIVGDELTASADGRVLGTVRDSTVTDAGDVVILSNAAAGYFRNIVYVPLDKPASAVASTSGTRDAPTVSATNVPAASAPRLSVSTEPWVNAMDNPELRKLTEAAGASLRFDDKGANVSLTGILKDGAVRMLFSFTDKSKAYACEVKARRAKKGDYSLHLSGVDNRTALHITRDESGKGLRSLGRFVLPGGKPWPAERPVELELRVVGTTLVGKLNGVELGRVEDGALTEGQLAIRLETGAVLHAVETLDLSKAEPTVPLAAGTASSAPPTADGWISLLPLIDPPRDKVEGDWKIVNGELQGGDSSFARLALPYSPPDEYDFRIRFTRESGNLAVSQHLASAGKDVMWLMGGFGNKSGGFEEVGGEKANANPTTIKTGLENGRRYESVVKVRRDRVQVEVDGKQVADYQTDWSDFSMNPKWTFPDPKKLGVGCQQATIFHSIEVLPVKASPPAASSDGGKPVASATPSPAPASPPQSATAKWLAEQEPQWQAAFAGEVSGPFEKGVADLKKQYLAALETQLAVVTKAAKLDDAVAFRDERARFTAGIEMPAEDEALMPASLTTLRASYRTTFAKLDKERFAKAKSVHARYDAILAQNLALLTQRQLFDEALEIKTKRDALSLAWLKPPAEPLRTNIAPQKPGAVALPEGAAPGVPIDKLPNLKTLQELEISAITPRDIMALKDAKKLRVLRVRGGGITDDDVRGIISVVPGLQDVSLGEWNAPASITNACVPALLGLKLPRSLDLCSKGIDDAALPTVAKMRTLLSLKLGGSSVSSSGLGALVALEALTSLDLHNTRIGDSGLEEIAKFKSLRTLDLSETNVSNAAVDKLKKALPRLQVTGVGKGK